MWGLHTFRDFCEREWFLVTPAIRLAKAQVSCCSNVAKPNKRRGHALKARLQELEAQIGEISEGEGIGSQNERGPLPDSRSSVVTLASSELGGYQNHGEHICSRGGFHLAMASTISRRSPVPVSLRNTSSRLEPDMPAICRGSETVPCARALPWSIIATLSQMDSAISRTWVLNRTATPSSARFLSRSLTIFAERGSRPFRHSSRIRILAYE